MTAITWDQARAWRVARSHLDDRVPKRSLLDVASRMCGVHAQVGSAAELSLSARVEGIAPSAVRDLLWKRRRLVRSWMMRGTIHLLPARDFPLYAAALGTHDRWWKGAWLKMVGLDAGQLRRLLATIRETMSDEPMTREELADAVAHELGPTAREWMLSGWGVLLKPAAFNGWVCSGPPRGQNVTFVDPRAWLGAWEERDGDEAIREVFRRYVRTYGPSTHEEFAAWWGDSLAMARRVRLSIDHELEEIDVEGARRWMLRKDAGGIRSTVPLDGSVRLLPNFDAYVMGFRPREQLLDGRFSDRVFRKAGWIAPVVLVDGRIAGVWANERVRGSVEVAIQPFRRLGADVRKAIAGEADRLGEFLDAPAKLSYSPVVT